MAELFTLAVLTLLLAAAVAIMLPWPGLTRALAVLGGIALIIACVGALVGAEHLRLAGVSATHFALDGAGLWLGLFGAIPATLALALGSPAARLRAWYVGAIAAILGALGVMGVHGGVAFLIAWELMSLGGALMLLSERLGISDDGGHATLLMLGLLEVGAVALLAGWLTFALLGGGMAMDGFAAGLVGLPGASVIGLGLLMLVGFGAKLGLLPFYEWFAGAYASGSGASASLMSGIVLNAAWFALARALLVWLPPDEMLGIITVAVAAFSAILAVLYALQADDWRQLLGLSSAENAAIATLLLGAALIFRSAGLGDLSMLAWIVGLLHLAGHSLSKGAMLLGADGAYRARGTYRLQQSGLLRASVWTYGVGIVFAGMSLAGMPPQAGFVSEWFAFQTLFQNFQVPDLAGRLTLALGGVGLALTAALAYATFVKIIGLGTQGAPDARTGPVPRGHALAVGLLGILVLALAVGMPWWLYALDPVAQHWFAQSSMQLRSGLLLVPLNAHFAFISPTLLVIVMPLLALLPIALALWSRRRHGVRRAPVWFGGNPPSPRAATTALTFSHAVQVFYSFIYRPRLDMEHEHVEREYFVRRLGFEQRIAPLFESRLFRPLTRMVWWLSDRIVVLQSGDMNLYLALIGVLLIIVLGVGVI